MHKNDNVLSFNLSDKTKGRLSFREAANAKYLIRLDIFNNTYLKCFSRYTCDRYGKIIAYDDEEFPVYLDVAIKVLKELHKEGKITDQAYKWAVDKSYITRELYK